MPQKRLVASVVLGMAGCLELFASGPGDRTATDPKRVISAEQTGVKAADIPGLLTTVRLGEAAWSPDGKQIAYVGNASGRFNVWVMNADGTGARQLVKSDEGASGVTWSQNGQEILFGQDRGGDELYDIYAVPARGGEPKNLTHTDQIAETGPRFSPDGRWLVLERKGKKEPSTDLEVMNWATHEVRQLTHESDPKKSWRLVTWSPDGRTLYALRGDMHEDASVYAVNVETGAATELTPHPGKVLIRGGGVSPDGRFLVVGSTERKGYSNVALLDVKTKKLDWVTDTEWEARPGSFAPDGKRFTYMLNSDGRTSLHFVGTDSREDAEAKAPEGINEEAATPPFSRAGDYLFLHEDSTHPNEYYVRGQDGAVRQITETASATLKDLPLPKAELVHYPSFDGKLISAFVWMPFNLKRDGTNPAIVLPHGGPTWQTVDSFSPRVIALVSRGYILIAPNVRGSTGYGTEFQKANYQDLGGGDLKDCLQAVKFLKLTGYADEKKIGITGGSYGGFMTLMAIGKAPDIWAAAVEEYGIIDWYTMLKHSDPYLQEYEKSLLGDPEKDRAKYEDASPIKFIRNEKAPLLVLQGERDIRVPKEEAAQVVSILKSEGRTVDAVYYPQEGHGFQKRENQVDEYTRIVDWFDKYLKDGQKN